VDTIFGHRNHTVTDGGYRYLTHSDGSEELYDRQTNLNEWTNRADDPSLDRVTAELMEWLPERDEPDARRGL
jgi:hypothetical protein